MIRKIKEETSMVTIGLTAAVTALGLLAANLGLNASA